MTDTTTTEPQTDDAQRRVEDWNATHPVGTPVRYWRMTRDHEAREGKTTYPAQLLGRTAVVWIDTCSGAMSLTHVDPTTAKEA